MAVGGFLKFHYEQKLTLPPEAGSFLMHVRDYNSCCGASSMYKQVIVTGFSSRRSGKLDRLPSEKEIVFIVNETY